MNLEVDLERLFLAQKAVCAELLAERSPAGYWVGEIGSSPVATAAAVSALVVSHHQDSDDALREAATGGSESDIEQLVQGDLSELLLESVHWLARRQNEDGGWSDCDGGESDIAATMLVQAAFRLTGIPGKYADLMMRADQFVSAQGGVAGLRRRFGRYKTYLAPILANCALADMAPWRQVPTLAFEWLSLPQRWQRDVAAPASRIALPIVMSVGLAKFHNDPPHNPLMRLVRRSLRKKTLAALEALQATDNSFLASPLATAFVVMNLASIGCQEHPIVERGVEFLLASVRADASWSIATNLATTNTALALESLMADRPPMPVSGSVEWHEHHNSGSQASNWHDTATANDMAVQAEHDVHQAANVEIGELSKACVDWLLETQRTSPSKLTAAPAGGWGASDSAGAEPNTIATAGALVTLAHACRIDADMHRGRVERVASLGVNWLLAMQNDDGGWPTYCRNEDSQPLDASGIDPTAHAVRALAAWLRFWRSESCGDSQSAQTALGGRIDAAIARALPYLGAQQREDGSFVPMWFGNLHQAEDQNPVLGTAVALSAYANLDQLDSAEARRAASWLLISQHSSGGWGPPRAPVDYSDNERDGKLRSWRENDTLAKFCTIEETAAAVSALLPLAATDTAVNRSVSRGLAWLANSVEQDGHRRPAIVGFYFSRIWYYERLYPLAFAAGALSRAVGAVASARPATSPVG